MASKKKITTAVTAATLAVALAVGGTFAWQSISQTALNEASDVVNPGGRLHSDFYIDADGDYNSDIYVENFADDEIFARVKLSEYMEVVINQGVEGAEIVDTIAGSKSLNDAPVTDKATDNTSGYEYEYVTHYFDQENETDEYWDWTTGDTSSEPVYYMPTFNMNKDSLVADRNGMYVDRIGGISNDGRSQAQYEDWETWAEGDTKDGTEIHDFDSNSFDEVGYDFENLDQYVQAENIAIKESETHTAAPVGTSNGLISMSEWLQMIADNGDVYDEVYHGNYWVYDTDGWVYWSSPIAGGEATGLLLDSIQLDSVMDDTWYYAIEATGQFVTANDVGKKDGTGFYGEGEAPSGDAETLLEAIGVDMSGDTGDDSGGDDEYYGDGVITVNGYGPNEDGYIYLYGLDIDQNNSFEVKVSEDFELAENGLTAVFHEDEIEDTKMVVSETDPYSATLTIAARDYHSVTITATDVNGETETVTVVPVYSTIVITPSMDGETLMVPSGYYSLRAAEFNSDNVGFTLNGAKRSNIVEVDGADRLNVTSYESSTDITLTASDGNQIANVKIVVVGAQPYDGPIYTYYIQGSGDTWAYAFMETQDYAWEQNDDYTYQVRAGMTNDFAGTIEWTINGNSGNQTAYFVNGDEDSGKLTYTGLEPNIKFTAEQTQEFTLNANIYVDQEKTTIMTDAEGNPYDYFSQYFTIYPTKTGKPVVYHLSVRSDDHGSIYLAPGEYTEVYFNADIRAEGESISNADVTWSLEQAEPGCTFTIEEGDAGSNTATVTHTCTADTCTKIGAVKAVASYDHAYGQKGTGEFFIVAADYDGNLELEGGSEEGGGDDPESSSAMTFASNPQYTDNGDSTANISVSKNRAEDFIWNLYSCSEGTFTLTSSNASVTFEPYNNEESNRNVDMNIIIPATVTDDFTVTATSMDGTKSVTFNVVMIDNTEDTE